MENIEQKDDKEIKEVQELLGVPFALDFSDYTSKVRNNLMFSGVLSMILVVNDLKLNKDSSILGLKFDSLSMELIYQILFWLVLYFLIHFTWLAWDSFVKWKLRLTGTHRMYQNRSPDLLIDNANDLSQTTLYFWWMKQSKNLVSDQGNIQLAIDRLRDDLIIGLDEKSASEINKSITTLTANLQRHISILSPKRIIASLDSFDNWYKHMQTTQNRRWFYMELLTPIMIGLCSLCSLFIVVY